MSTSIAYRVYRRILLLYPEPFRREFGEEMLSLFDECRATQRSSFLLIDGLAAALKQQWRYWMCDAPQRTALYAEVPSAPMLARMLATGVIAVAICRGVLGRSERPAVETWPRIRIVEHNIWYLQCSNVVTAPKLEQLKHHRGE